MSTLVTLLHLPLFLSVSLKLTARRQRNTALDEYFSVIKVASHRQARSRIKLGYLYFDKHVEDR